MSAIKRHIEDIAELVTHEVENGIPYVEATAKVLIDNKIIADASDKETINLYIQNIGNYVLGNIGQNANKLK